MEPENQIPKDLRASALIALLRMQITEASGAIEQHGVELGMLLRMLLELIERHGQEAPPEEAPELSQESALWQQLAADHSTMRSFSTPLLMLLQFYDRLRQRLEHLEQALCCLPADQTLDREVMAHAMALFPLDEERAVSARVSGSQEPETEGPILELFP